MIKRPPLKWIIYVLVLFIITAGISWQWQSCRRQGRYRDLLSAIYVMGVVKLHYYQPVSLLKLSQTYLKKGNISDTLKTLGDPYTRYLGKNEYAELCKDTEGTFGGIGIYLMPKENELLISSVVKGSPGEKAGLQQGDRITGVEGKSVKALGTEVAIAKIRGLAGTKILLRITRGEGQNGRELNISIVRADISIPTVELTFKQDRQLGEYAYLKITQFADTTPADLDSRVAEILKSPARAIVLDLRANPGGALNAAIKVAGVFLPVGTPVLHILSRNYSQKTVKSETGGQCTRLPMVVLVDSWSASASEIVSGALKDQKRAYLVGTHTFGKDLIQEVKDLPGKTGVTITIASYLTSGRVNIHKKGVMPNRVVEIPGAMDRLLKQGDTKLFLKMQQHQEQAAIEYLRKEILKNLKFVS